MKSVFKPVLIAGLMATLGFSAFAQTPGQGGPSQREGMGKMDPAKMQERMAAREAVIKAKLKLTPAQEGAWTTYVAAMKLPADMKRPDRAEVDKLTTPERIDKMRALRTQRDVEIDKRADATKAFYATLTPEQKKVFDANTGRPFHGPEGRGPRKE